MRIGLVGYGTGGQHFHAPFIAAAGGVALAGVVARAPGTIAKIEADLPAAVDPKLPLIVLPVGILGTVAGAKLTRILSDGLFFLLVHVALITVSLKLVFDALPFG
jgi:uncharacterized membrane protein YfcA